MRKEDDTMTAQKGEPENAGAAQKANKKPPVIPEIAICGKIDLKHPILSRDTQVKELRYDFGKLNSWDLVDCLDADRAESGYANISNKQAFLLFCRTVGKTDRERTGLDEVDVAERIHADDAMAALKVARLFFVLKSREAETRIHKMS